jgi:nucleotide-binding universal stress UspA family protein
VKIVVGYLDSPEGRAALEHGIQETRLRDGTLVVMNSMRGSERERDIVATREGFEATEARLRREGIDHSVRQLVRDVPAGEDLVAFAREEAADLIVIGIRRRSPVGKLVLGSNAQHVLLHADCPVLAVKAAEER